MEFTSGYTGTARLDESLGHIDNNNVYGSFTVDTTPLAVAQALYGAGWSVRKESWYEYEVTCSWCEFTLMPTTPVVFAGVLDLTRAGELIALLAGLGFPCELDEPTG